MKNKYFGIGAGFFLLSLLGTGITSASSVSTFNSQQIVQLANQDRTSQGLAPLAQSDKLQLAANLKLDDMIANDYFDHVSPEGTQPWYFLKRAGYSYAAAGENLALNFSEPDKVEQAWMNSTEHRQNILNSKFTEVGIAQKEVVYKGQRTNFIVEFFGAAQ